MGLATALIIALLGPRSGGSANPARQLGPALTSGNTTHLWIYPLAPVIGALAGADIWRPPAALTRQGRIRHALRSAPDTHPDCPASAPGRDAWCCGERAM
ncbi:MULTISPECIES: aquaporin [unclassified Streptomyces]|uniref:aquaporin n=1 Tax=unclassified Streptomyces TaxID=2593676 RepID=UPI000F90940F|nr:aquaporin [Streptomyces sp. ADI95-17]RPK61136.1 aquaporin Z [Streptomyces sp. ADI95-17]WSG48731.1 aquaporin [Streptomyces sp. NBC_01732]WSW99381.1 aquaporin [Streptomyces sp. NBC_00987]